MASIGALFLLLSLLSQADAHLRVRGLQEGRVPKGVFRNPCTGSWSNDAEVLNIDDCDAYLKDQGLTGSNSGLGGGSDGNGDRDGASNYDCSIKGNDDPTSPTVFRRVEYWYCVENSQNETTWLPKLEEKIYNIAVDRMTWCIGYPVQRDLREEERVGRHLGVLGVSSQPSDKLRSDGKDVVIWGGEIQFAVQSLTSCISLSSVSRRMLCCPRWFDHQGTRARRLK